VTGQALQALAAVASLAMLAGCTSLVTVLLRGHR
jgi:hypothetical protein